MENKGRYLSRLVACFPHPPPTRVATSEFNSRRFAQIGPSVYRSSGFYLFRAPEIRGWMLGADPDDPAPLAYAKAQTEREDLG